MCLGGLTKKQQTGTRGGAENEEETPGNDTFFLSAFSVPPSDPAYSQ